MVNQSMKEMVEKFVAALIAAGKLNPEDAKHVTLREDSKGKFHIEILGVSPDAALRFKKAMATADIPANYTIKKANEA
jgi:hypothetical protein